MNKYYIDEKRGRHASPFRMTMRQIVDERSWMAAGSLMTAIVRLS
jgi:hypothetical protein